MSPTVTQRYEHFADRLRANSWRNSTCSQACSENCPHAKVEHLKQHETIPCSALRDSESILDVISSGQHLRGDGDQRNVFIGRWFT